MNNHWRALVLGFTAGTLAGLMLAYRQRTAGRLPAIRDQATLERLLAEKRGVTAAQAIMAHTRQRYARLAATHPPVTNGALYDHIYNQILPGLALYQALLAEGTDQAEALQEMEELLAPRVLFMHRPLQLLGKLPNSFGIFRWLTRLLMRMNFPAEGWQQELVADTPECYAFNLHTCLCLDKLTAYGAPELTPVFCQMDDLMFAGLPDTITWERTQTLARGGAYCDFRWCRRQQA